ncbi:hypothetical protein A3K73_00155 [Candidatus Pacearchaeota archaeon RBG_13_36_9]|nr:MAG: hypothetical protein A3K73_00155 [Candidatus Pacearchaeota archaeon RBG_13_36_9]
MAGKTISDWIVEARKRKVDLENFDSDKKEDMLRLKKYELPQFHYLELPYSEFSEDNPKLKDFFSRYKGVCIRAIPNQGGKIKGFTRKYKMGRLSYKKCRKFLDGVIRENVKDYDIVMNDWEPNIYGFVLISGPRHVFGEIGKNLETLSHGDETPLATFDIDRRKIGHLENKITWLNKEDEEAAKYLLKALNHIKAPWDNFDPVFLRGYFEGVVTKTGIKFLDYKTNQAYTKGS